VQDPQILAVGHRWRLRPQRIIGHAEVARGEQLLPIAVVGERSGLARQPIDDVPVIDAMLVTATQPRQAFHHLLRVPHLEVLHEEADFDPLSDESAGHGVAVAVDVDQAAAINPRPYALARLQTPGRHGLKPRSLFGESRTPAGIELLQQLSQERCVVRTRGKVPAATQQQRLINRGLQSPVSLLDVAVFVGMIGLDLLACHPVMGQQCLVTLGELLLVGEVVDRSAHAVRAMTLRHSRPVR